MAYINSDLIEKLKNNGFIEQPVHARITLRIKASSFRAGTIRVMLPVPINANQLYEGQLLDFDPMFRMVSVEDYPQRTAYYNERLDENRPFVIEFAFENRMKYEVIDLNCVDTTEQKGFSAEQIEAYMEKHHCGCESYTALAPDAVSIMDFTAEDYIVFSKEKYEFLCDMGFLVQKDGKYVLSSDYAGKKGKIAYEISDIVCSEAYPGRKLDLAAEYVTLCRMCGVPARWQGGILGRVAEGEHGHPHSIAMVYLSPYGWVFVDLINKKETGDSYFFGNTDPGFIPTASRFGGSMYPAKDYARADEYFNVFGEVEMVPNDASEGYGLKSEDFETEIIYLS